MMRKAGLFLLLILISGSSLFAQEFFGNGGFEYGRDPFWKHVCGSGDEADFSIGRTKVMVGSKELKVSVTKKSSDAQAIYSSTKVTLSGDSIYLLRFWAHGKERTKIKISIIGETSTSVVYEMRPGRVLFHFPFKTNDKDVEIRIYYLEKSTYYLDGFEILNQNNDQNIDVLNTYIWNNGQVGNPAWVAGDNDVSFKLPDGRTVWFFNDSFIASANDPGNNALYNFGTFVRNAMVVEDTDGKLYARPFIDQGGQKVYFPVQDTIFNDNGSISNIYWVGDALMEDGMVKVYLVELTTSDGAVATERSYIGELSYPELELLDIKQQADFCYGYETFFVENDTIYLYKGTGEGFSRYMQVARTPLGNLIGAQPWEYWNGTAWSGDISEVALIAEYDPSGLIKLEDNSYAVVNLPIMGDEIDVAFAPAPEGPWTAKQKVYSIPHDSAYWWYMPNIHCQLPNGKYSISYSTNSYYDLFLSFESFEDKYWYRPRYIQIDLLGLSPYSDPVDCAGIKNGTAYVDDCGYCVGGTTGKSPCVDGTALLYADCDFGGVEVGLTVGDYMLGDMEAAGMPDQSLSSVSIKDGYEAVLYENDAFSGSSVLISDPVSCLDALSFNDMTSSLLVRRTGTENLSGSYVIQNAETGLYMGTELEVPENFDAVLQTVYHGYDSQKFSIHYLGNNYYKIVNVGSNLNLNFAFGDKDWTSELSLWDGLLLDFTENKGTLRTAYYDSPSGQGVANLIDNVPETEFLTFHQDTWVKYSYTKPFAANSYTLTSSDDAESRDPLNWALRGSNDGVTWVTLDTLSDQSFETRLLRKEYTIDNTTPYSYYLLDLHSGDAGALAFNEWEILNNNPQESDFDSYKFVIQDEGEGLYRFINKSSDLVLEIADNNTEPGVAVRQMPDYEQASGLWKLLNPDDVLLDAIGAELEIKDTRVLVYPNPAGDFIRIQAEDEFTGGEFRIISVTGSILLAGRFDNNVLDISSLPEGFYLLQLQNGDAGITTRFIRQ